MAGSSFASTRLGADRATNATRGRCSSGRDSRRSIRTAAMCSGWKSRGIPAFAGSSTLWIAASDTSMGSGSAAGFSTFAISIVWPPSSGPRGNGLGLGRNGNDRQLSSRRT